MNCTCMYFHHKLNYHDQFENRVYDVPESIDETIAQLKLEAFGVEIDTLTAEQEKYLNSWEMGT